MRWDLTIGHRPGSLRFGDNRVSRVGERACLSYLVPSSSISLSGDLEKEK
jgi:hypothetical protein